MAESIAGRGSVDALGDPLVDFCRAHHRRLVGMLGLYCGDTDLAEELAQEALARLCTHWDRLPSEEEAATWLNRVAFNLAKSSFRTRATRRRITDRFGATMGPRPADGDTDTALAVRAAVAALPERQRTVLLLRYFCDLGVKDVAEQMRCAEGTVKSLTALAIAALRRSGLEFTDD